MAHVNLARVLKFSNLLRNVFGASSFSINPSAATPGEMVTFTEFSIAAPIISFILCLIVLGFGFYIQHGVNQSRTEIPGIDMELGSLSMIVMQLTILSALLNYAAANYLTLTRRTAFRGCLVSLLEICQTLDEKYKTRYNPKELTLGINFALFAMPIYYFTYIFVFEGFTFNALDSYYLIPLAFMIQNMSASMTAIDFICPVHSLGDFIHLLGEVPANLKDGEFFATFTRTLDLFAVISQNHGNREFSSIANESFAMLTQFFYICYGISKSGEVNAASLYMALGGVVPRALKVMYIAQRGAMTEQIVSD